MMPLGQVWKVRFLAGPEQLENIMEAEFLMKLPTLRFRILAGFWKNATVFEHFVSRGKKIPPRRGTGFKRKTRRIKPSA